MGRHHRRSRPEDDDTDADTNDEAPYTNTLMPDTTSPFSCCCICYRYLLDVCLVLALSPFVINCFLEAIIYLVKFEWESISWGSAILAIIVVTLWTSMALFGVLCCISVVRKGVFTRRLRQKRKDLDDADFGKEQEEADSFA